MIPRPHPLALTIGYTTLLRSTDPDGGSAMYIVAPYARDVSWASSWTSPRPERPVLSRLVALAKASADTLVGWLSGEGKEGAAPTSWKHAFRSGHVQTIYDSFVTLLLHQFLFFCICRRDFLSVTCCILLWVLNIYIYIPSPAIRSHVPAGCRGRKSRRSTSGCRSTRP